MHPHEEYDSLNIAKSKEDNRPARLERLKGTRA